jgi:beta-N-acetylhexosaminidase
MRSIIRAALAALVAGLAPAQLQAESDVQDPQLDAMIGQMIMVGFQGTSASQASVKQVLADLEAGRVGGVILMGANVRSKAQVAALNEAIRAAAEPHIPLIAVDQEGGAVQRLSREKGFQGFPGPRLVASRQDPKAAYETYTGMARELRRHGFNVNFGPTVDMDRNRANPIIAKLGRSYGEDPGRVTGYASAFVRAHRDAGVATSAKHFPGHGSSFTDSHKGFVDLSKTWDPTELDPYRALAARGEMDMVMVGHLYHPSFSGGARLPATFARPAIEGMLRRDIGYDGVVITDDLAMGAITKFHTVDETLVRTVEAGVDILLFCSTPRVKGPFAAHAIRTIRAAVRDGRIPRSRIEQSYRRIVALKRRLGDTSSAASPAAYVPESAAWRHPDTGELLP